MKKLFLLPALLLLLSACDAVDDMKEMLDKQKMVQQTISEKYGWQSQVGFNFHNGVLTQVTLVLNADDVRNENVSRLENIAREVISSSFKSTPKVIFIQISSNP